MTAHLGPNRYGKSGIRLATVDRVGDRHRFTDLEVSIRLEGDFEAAHLAGDNSAVLPTDTMRGTCYALAREGIDTVPAFARKIAGRLLEACPAASSAWIEVTSFPWEHVRVDGVDHPHTFRPAAGGIAVVAVTCRRDGQAIVTGGVRGLRLLKTTGSAFSGYLTDRYTTLPETRDRIMATTVEATWGLDDPSDVEVATLAAAVPDTFAARFATHDDSESVQHTLHAMGTAVLDAHADVTWIHFRLPNEHHVPADLSAYGLDNPNRVFVATDRPFGVIEATVVRDGAGSGP